MEMRNTVAERFVVQLRRSESYLDRCYDLRQLCEVKLSRRSVQVMDLADAFLRDEEARTREILIGIEPDIASLQPSDRPDIVAGVMRRIVGANRTVRHESIISDPEPAGADTCPRSPAAQHLKQWNARSRPRVSG